MHAVPLPLARSHRVLALLVVVVLVAAFASPARGLSAQPPASPSPSPSSASRATARTGEPADAVAKAVAKAGRDVDYALGKLEALMKPHDPSSGIPPESPAALEARARRHLAEAADFLVKLEGRYAGRLPSPAPDIDAARTRIATSTTRVDAWLAGLRSAAGAAATSAAEAGKAASAGRAAAERDAARMLELHARHFPRLDPITGNSLFFGSTLDEARTAVVRIETVETEVLPELAPELGALADTYGTDPLTVANRLHERGWRGDVDPSSRFVALVDSAAKLARSRTATAAALLQFADGLGTAFSGQITDAQIGRLRSAREFLLLAARLDPSSDAVRSRLGSIDDRIAATARAMEKDIDARVWAGHVAAFPGPGSTSALASAALAYFRQDRDWGARPTKPSEVLAVAIRGPWLPAERDAFGRVTCWRLPVHLAITTTELRPRGLAQVFDLSVVAREGAPEKAPREPPFDGFWVGDNWLMRLERVK
jgi:hypothetical protein